jgi:uncharacterized membrane protein
MMMSFNFTENNVRSIGKVITWRLIQTINHTLLGWWASGSWTTGLQVAGIALVVNSFYYWAHERIWNKIQWGKAVKEEQAEQAH